VMCVNYYKQFIILEALDIRIIMAFVLMVEYKDTGPRVRRDSM